MVQWLGLLAFTAGGAQVPSLIRELKIPQAELCCGGGKGKIRALQSILCIVESPDIFLNQQQQ